MKLLREEISDKKTAISTITKGIPFTKLEVRPDDQLPPTSFNLGGPRGPAGLPVPTSKASMIVPLPRKHVRAIGVQILFNTLHL